MLKNLPAVVGDLGLIPGLGRFPGEGHGYLLQYSCLENPMDTQVMRKIVNCKIKPEITQNITQIQVVGEYKDGIKRCKQ